MSTKLSWEDQMRAMIRYARRHRLRVARVQNTTFLRFMAIKTWIVENGLG